MNVTPQDKDSRNSPYVEIHVDSWAHAKEFLTKRSGDWIFRGQSDASRELSTTYEREIAPRFWEAVRYKLAQPRSEAARYWLPHYEQKLIEQFKKAAHLYIRDSRTPEHPLDWLALMQHYGVPTRLLDFTSSPYVASFFAFIGKQGGEKRAVWALEQWVSSGTAAEILAEDEKLFSLILDDVPSLNWDTRSTRLDIDYLESPEFFDAFLRRATLQGRKLILPLTGYMMNDRMLVQQAILVMPTDLGSTFMENMAALTGLYAPGSTILYKLVIPSTERPIVLEDLYRMNITYGSLFPGLEGYARSLADRIFLDFDPNTEKNRISHWRGYFSGLKRPVVRDTDTEEP